MKLATFVHPLGHQAIGAVNAQEQSILDLDQAYYQLHQTHLPAFSSMLALINSSKVGLDIAKDLVKAWSSQAVLPLHGLRILSPLPRPEQIRDCLVFEQHLLNAMKTWELLTKRPSMPVSPLWYQRPTWYKGNRFSVVGHEAEVQWPPYSELMDFELELACVIGKTGRDISESQALSHIFGFTIFNDFSARDTQMDERPLGMGPMKGKDFDTGNVLGPWIVTTDEIEDPQNLQMHVRINGERWGGGNSKDMHHSFAKILSFISVSETLHPGEVIASGTVPTGCGLELNRFLKPNDVVELEIEKIGILRNKIVRPKG
jgi:2-keto-4-pentenoate hydratase/2-oxohepta-3-ene-1,7-dioic acid hydratase in catechol pathway